MNTPKKAENLDEYDDECVFVPGHGLMGRPVQVKTGFADRVMEKIIGFEESFSKEKNERNKKSLSVF